jgi:four helix bundle protein
LGHNFQKSKNTFFRQRYLDLNQDAIINKQLSMNNKNVLYDKSYAFAIRIVKAYQYLGNEKKEFIISKQLLRSGTSIGANVSEANGAISKSDFSAKISIAYKECLEVKYWLSLLKDTGYIDNKTFKSILDDADELGRILFAILKTTRIKKSDN